MKKLIGKSFSFCIKSIIEGEVRITDVEKIVCGTRAVTPTDFRHLLAHCVKNYWKRSPETACHIARYFWNQGMLDQPRVYGEEAPNISDRKIWIDA